MSVTNHVSILGRLTKDVEINKTTSGKSVASFCIALDNGKDRNGNQNNPDYIDCVIWDKNADNLARYAHKGNLVAIDGELKTRSYQKQDGTRVKVTEVLVREWKNTSPRNSSNQNEAVEEQFDDYMNQQGFYYTNEENY